MGMRYSCMRHRIQSRVLPTLEHRRNSIFDESVGVATCQWAKPSSSLRLTPMFGYGLRGVVRVDTCRQRLAFSLSLSLALSVVSRV